MIDLLTKHGASIADLCRRHDVVRLDAFGSAVTSAFDPKRSDIDLIAEFAKSDRPGYADRFIGLAEDLERLLGRSVDLLTPGMVGNPIFRRSIEETRQPIYVAEHS